MKARSAESGIHSHREGKIVQVIYARVLTDMTDSTPTPRWLHPTPAWLIVALLVVEGLLFLSERFQWPAWHKGYAVLIAVASVAVVFVVMLLWFGTTLLLPRPSEFSIRSLLVRTSMLYDRPVEGSRFQFSIRSLLLLTLAVAIPCSWLAVEIKAAKKQRETVEAIEQLDGRVYYLQERSEPAWLQSPLGKDFFANIGTVELSSAHITDIELGRLNLKSQGTEPIRRVIFDR
jgi:hypothetical protein